MLTLLLIILATVVDGLTAFIGAFSMVMKEKTLKKLLLAMIAFSAGTLLAGGLFHLLPESLGYMDINTASLILLVGFCAFFVIERFLHWHHCHDGKCDVHSFTYLILIGDGVHNFIDGLVIAASFVVGVQFGFLTTVLIIAHELPQELGDFGALIYGGFKRKKALLFNFASQLTCVAGGVAGYLLSGFSGFYYLIPLAAGGFFYIAASDLIPELHKESDLRKSLVSFAMFIVGIAFMIAMKALAGG